MIAFSTSEDRTSHSRSRGGKVRILMLLLCFAGSCWAQETVLVQSKTGNDEMSMSYLEKGWDTQDRLYISLNGNMYQDIAAGYGLDVEYYLKNRLQVRGLVVGAIPGTDFHANGLNNEFTFTGPGPMSYLRTDIQATGYFADIKARWRTVFGLGLGKDGAKYRLVSTMPARIRLGARVGFTHEQRSEPNLAKPVSGDTTWVNYYGLTRQMLRFGVTVALFQNIAIKPHEGSFFSRESQLFKRHKRRIFQFGVDFILEPSANHQYGMYDISEKIVNPYTGTAPFQFAERKQGVRFTFDFMQTIPISPHFGWKLGIDFDFTPFRELTEINRTDGTGAGIIRAGLVYGIPAGAKPGGGS